MSDFSRVEKAIADFQQGKIVMVMDSFDRENECDFVVAGETCTTEQMAFMIRYSTGIVCAVTDKEHMDHFGLHPATTYKNTDKNETNFYVSTDYLPDTTTGVSARDRAVTLRALSDLTNKAEDFSKPGHMFPLCSKPNGLMERDGHTESAFELCRLSGREHVAAIAEMMTDDGEMMRYDDVVQFSVKHDLSLITVPELREYIIQKRRVLLASSCTINVEYIANACQLFVYRGDISGNEYVVLQKGEVSGQTGVPLRVHSECFTGDIFRSQKCDCGQQLVNFMKTMNVEENALLIYIKGHEGRGIGLANKLKAYDLQDRLELDTVDSNIKLGFNVDLRDYTDINAILKNLSVGSVNLFTNNPEKVQSINSFVEKTTPIPSVPNCYNVKYLKTKQERLFHKTVLNAKSSSPFDIYEDAMKYADSD